MDTEPPVTYAELRALFEHLDCEIMLNVAQQWEERVGYVPEE
jgi:hypothetical protein